MEVIAGFVVGVNIELCIQVQILVLAVVVLVAFDMSNYWSWLEGLDS